MAFLPVVWVMLVSFGVYLGVHAALQTVGTVGAALPGCRPWLRDPCVYLQAGIFVLAMDFWAWGRVYPVVMGVPAWIGLFHRPLGAPDRRDGVYAATAANDGSLKGARTPAS